MTTEMGNPHITSLATFEVCFFGCSEVVAYREYRVDREKCDVGADRASIERREIILNAEKNRTADLIFARALKLRCNS